jgi:hypothetical protein
MTRDPPSVPKVRSGPRRDRPDRDRALIVLTVPRRGTEVAAGGVGRTGRRLSGVISPPCRGQRCVGEFALRWRYDPVT